MSKADDLARKFAGRIQPASAATASPSSSALPQDGLADRDLRQLSPHDIMADPTQPRKEFDELELERLGQRLKVRQYQAIRVRWSAEHKKWMLIYGERRWRAALKVGLPSLFCEKISRPITPEEILEEQIVENCHRKDLNQMEKAESWQRFMAMKNLNATEMADYLNLDRSTVSHTLKLLALPEERREQVRQEILPAREAIKAARLPDPVQREQAFEEAVAGKIEPQRKASRSPERQTFTATNGVKVTLAGTGGINAWLAALEEIQGQLRKNHTEGLAS